MPRAMRDGSSFSRTKRMGRGCCMAAGRSREWGSAKVAAMTPAAELGVARRGRVRGGGRWPFIGDTHYVLSNKGTRGTQPAHRGAGGVAGGWHEKGPARCAQRRGTGRRRLQGSSWTACNLGMRGRRGTARPAWGGPGSRWRSGCHAAHFGVGARRRGSTSPSLISFSCL